MRTKLKDQQRLARKTRKGKRIQGQEKTLTSLSLAFCALLSPAASAGAGAATAGGSTAATAPSAGTTGTRSGMEDVKRRESSKMAQRRPGKKKRAPS